MGYCVKHCYHSATDPLLCPQCEADRKAGRNKMDCANHLWFNRGLQPCPQCYPDKAPLYAEIVNPVKHPDPKAANPKPALPLDSAERKRWPLYSGLMAYFPAALANVANHSFIGNEKHNPGQPMNHARNKSSDHEDCIMRHLMDAAEHAPGSAGRIDELRGVAWRALALLQVECEAAGYRTAPAATFKDK